MIDIHCHLIPAIDDGARDLEESLELLRMAAEDGIKRMVLTPHFHLGRYDNTKASIESEFSKLKQAVKDEAIELELASAAEVRLDSELLFLLQKDLIPLYGTFEGQQYMLLELPHSFIPPGTLEFVRYMVEQKITPVIAHPERNRELLTTPETIGTLANAGCWFQITAGSIIGQFGERSQQVAEYYINKGFVNLVASDAHNIKHRPPILSQARAKVVELVGEELAQKLFWQNPYDITASLFV